MAQDQATVKLHWLNGSRAQSILFLLELLQVPYELEIYHRDKNKLAPPELTKVHPLGKSPVVTITPPGGGEPIVLAETAFIVQYLSEHFGDGFSLVPKRWKEGQEGKIGGETDEWLRYQYIMYYNEGSFMSMITMYFIFNGLRGPNIPFFIRPLTRMVANQVIGMLISPTLQKHFAMLDYYVRTSPYLVGEQLTGADIAMSYAIVALKTAGDFDAMATWEKGTFPETYPKLWEYMGRIERHPAWQKSADKIKDIEGKFSLVP